jgi:hypothetical protein
MASQALHLTEVAPPLRFITAAHEAALCLLVPESGDDANAANHGGPSGDNVSAGKSAFWQRLAD